MAKHSVKHSVKRAEPKPKSVGAAATPSVETETVSLDIPADWAISVHGHDFDVDDLVNMGPKGLAYVCSNGVSQSIVDAGAITKEQKAGKSEREVEDLVRSRRATRATSIRNGEVGHRVVGVRGSTIERVMLEIAEERLKAKVLEINLRRRSAGQPPMASPKGELRKAALAKVLELQGDDIRAEAEARMATNKAAGESLDLGLKELGLQ